MKCPFCGTLDNKVIDSRLSQGGEVTRRRRECEGCQRRYTTYERVEQVLPLVVKKDGRREPFDRMKILGGLHRACVKRPVSAESLERLVDDLERVLVETGDKEVSSTVVGERVMDALRELDHVAYVRFASVYRQFKDTNEFLSELSQLLQPAHVGRPPARTREPRDAEREPSREPRRAEVAPDSDDAIPTTNLLKDRG
ncbi:MAG: transcriptional regulator NrdR [Sandaracinaceae bacterium]|nr:transcriptional regulator NrdR [Sandaracinaceae bacterium]